MTRMGRIRDKLAKAVWGLAAFLSLVFVLAHASQIHAQSKPDDGPSALPSFEVVSVKPYPPNYWPTSSYKRFTPDGFIWKNTIAQDILVYAYNLRDPKLSNKQRLIPGGDKWMLHDWFDVQARMSDADIVALSKLKPVDQEAFKHQLLQSVLADRFKLRVHHVTRESPALALVVAKKGPNNMKRVSETEEARPIPSDFNHIRWQAAPMSMLVDLLVDLEDVPVLDKTGLAGKYDFALAFSRHPETRMLPGNSLPATNDAEPTIFDALKDQLGLRLAPIKIPVDEIVIDHIEKPSPN